MCVSSPILAPVSIIVRSRNLLGGSHQSETCHVAQISQIKDTFSFGYDLVYCDLLTSIRLGQLWRRIPSQCLGPLHFQLCGRSRNAWLFPWLPFGCLHPRLLSELNLNSDLKPSVAKYKRSAEIRYACFLQRTGLQRRHFGYCAGARSRSDVSSWRLKTRASAVNLTAACHIANMACHSLVAFALSRRPNFKMGHSHRQM